MDLLTRAAFALALAGCVFSPDLGDGTLACAADGSCPPGLACGGDGRCHRSTIADGGAPDLDPAAPDFAASDLACVPATCKLLGYDCGRALDGCGHFITCGQQNCDHGDTCGGAGPNTCGALQCRPLTCNQVPACGLVSNGCDDVLDCPC